jgi:transposase
VDRRKRRRKTDADALLRTLMAWARGERRVCSMVPSPEDELGAEGPQARRRLSRERGALVKEWIQHSNRIKLAAQGIADFEPLRPDHRARLDRLTTGDGRALPPRLTAEIRPISRLLRPSAMPCSPGTSPRHRWPRRRRHPRSRGAAAAEGHRA